MQPRAPSEIASFIHARPIPLLCSEVNIRNDSSQLTDLLIRKLGANSPPLDAAERNRLQRLGSKHICVPPRTDILRVGDHPSSVHFLLKGMAFRYTILAEGKRQITLFHIPGDVLDMPALLIPTMDYAVASLGGAELMAIPHSAMLALFCEYPRIALLFWRETLIYAAIFRERMTGLGRRDAVGRIAHIFCEIITRLRAIRDATAHEIELPITQVDLADALGLSAVHVNRSIQKLRRAGLIELTRYHLKAVDWKGLCKIGEFDPTYLHH